MKIEDIQKEIDDADSKIKIKFIDYMDILYTRQITDHGREVFLALRKIALDSKIRFKTPNVFSSDTVFSLMQTNEEKASGIMRVIKCRKEI